MGQFLTQPKTDKTSFDEADEDSGIRYGVTSMQGWRAGMEDAHLCDLDFDNGRKLFGVFDGHAGPEVAHFLALHLGEFILKNKTYLSSAKDKKINVKKLGRALTETFMTVDAHLLTDEAIEELEKLSENHPERGSCDDTDEEKLEAEELEAEAKMSLPELMAKYGDAFSNSEEGEEETDKSKQAKQHLKALAKQAGYDIDFGTDGDEDDGNDADDDSSDDVDKKTKVKSGAVEAEEKAASSAQQEEETVAASPKRRGRKAQKPSKVEAGPVDVTPGDVKSAAAGRVDEKKTSPAKQKKNSESAAKSDEEAKTEEADSDSDDSDYEVDGKADSDDDDDDDEEEEEEDVKNIAKADDEDAEDEEEEDEEESEEDSDDNMEDSIVSGDMDGEDEDFPVGVGKSSGSTAVAALLIGDQLVVANTGDSRCVLCRAGEAVAMSEDHQPENEEEKARVERAGGVVSEYGRVNNGLNMSRAIGDHHYKTREELPADEQMIIAKPDIRTETIGEEDEFLIMACDGIWNCMSNEECVKFVRKRMMKRGASTCLSAICEEVCDHCLAPDITGDGTGTDNMTMMIVLLKKDFGAAPPAVRRRKARHSTVAAADEEPEAQSPARKRTRRSR